MNRARPGQGAGPVQASADQRNDRRRPTLWVAGLIAISVLTIGLTANLSFAAPGDGLVHEVTWIHESPSEVRSFVIFVSPVAGSVDDARRVDVGKPGGSGSDSAQFFSALVPVGVGEFVAIAAVGRNGLLSDLSGWSPAQPSQPGQPLVVDP